MRVVQITDIHMVATEGEKLLDIDPALALEKIVADILTLEQAPELLLATGDLAEHGDKPSYQRLQKILAPINGDSVPK